MQDLSLNTQQHLAEASALLRRTTGLNAPPRTEQQRVSEAHIQLDLPGPPYGELSQAKRGTEQGPLKEWSTGGRPRTTGNTRHPATRGGRKDEPKRLGSLIQFTARIGRKNTREKRPPSALTSIARTTEVWEQLSFFKKGARNPSPRYNPKNPSKDETQHRRLTYQQSPDHTEKIRTQIGSVQMRNPIQESNGQWEQLEAAVPIGEEEIIPKGNGERPCTDQGWMASSGTCEVQVRKLGKNKSTRAQIARLAEMLKESYIMGTRKGTPCKMLFAVIMLLPIKTKAFDPYDWAEYHNMIDGTLDSQAGWTTLAALCIISVGIAILVISRLDNILKETNVNVTQTEWMTTRRLLQESESAFTRAKGVMSKMGYHIQGLETELKEKPEEGHIEKWKQAVLELAPRQQELKTARDKSDRFGKKLESRPEAGTTEEQVQKLMETKIRFQEKLAETTQKLQDAVNRTAIIPNPVHKEGRSVINDPLKLDGAKREEYESWKKAIREKIKGDEPTHFTNAETVWEYLCASASGKVVTHMRTLDMNKFLPGPNTMLDEGTEKDYVLNGFLLEEMNTAAYLKKLVIGQVFKTTKEGVAAQRLADAQNCLYQKEEKKWWDKKNTVKRVEQTEEQVNKYSPAQLENMKEKALGKPGKFRDKCTRHQKESGSCFLKHWETPQLATGCGEVLRSTLRGDEDEDVDPAEKLGQQPGTGEDRIKMVAIEQGNAYYMRYAPTLIVIDCGGTISIYTEKFAINHQLRTHKEPCTTNMVSGEMITSPGYAIWDIEME
ncbi:hypothetical protein BDD12DRAFT_809001 [Trichophaea hybrida]|nr:hypothetical protein BDD12DRAFT_809001 [Trichophaea hybrida]